MSSRRSTSGSRRVRSGEAGVAKAGRPRGWGRTELRRPPEGKIRQSQVVSTFGPGAMVDLLDNAVLVGGLDFWSFDPQRPARVIQEPRLRDALAAGFQAAGRKLSLEYAFREPPAGDDADPRLTCGIRVLEFPGWFVCQNPVCRALVRAIDGLEKKAGRYRHTCGRDKTGECVPVRFVMACRRGHLDEFPWI